VRCINAIGTDPPAAVVPERLSDDVFAPAVLKANVYVWRTYPPLPMTHIRNSVDLTENASESATKKLRVDFEREEHSVAIPHLIRSHVRALPR